jgi:23S rRNA (adenine2503-C2)-methyltransferase
MDILSMNLSEIEALLSADGLPAYRATQLFDALQNKGVARWDDVTTLPKELRARLAGQHPLWGCAIERKQVSTDGTVKYLFRLHDGETVESVVLGYKHGQSICVSTQAGCARGCAFCASTVGGCRRNLTAGEILGQIHAANRDLGVRIRHCVLMGMGEPLDNLPAVLRFLALAMAERGLNLSGRSISLSTCGVIPGIRALAAQKLPLTLSVSLHAPSNALRDTLMPVNREYPLAQLLAACRDYAAATGRRISFEYALLREYNDSPTHARQLAQILRTMPAHVNLIPVNPTRGAFRPSTPKAAAAFRAALEAQGIPATIRRTLGQDIDAACGQLASKLSMNNRQ